MKTPTKHEGVPFYAGIGARKTPGIELALMTVLARGLADAGYGLRSGGADGADTAFEEGVMAWEPAQIFLPWKGFNNNPSDLYEPMQAAYDIAAELHPAWDRCSEAAMHFHARNVHQMLGPSLTDPSHFVICWTHHGAVTGGTGMALRIAEYHEIPVVNLYDYTEKPHQAVGERINHLINERENHV